MQFFFTRFEDVIAAEAFTDDKVLEVFFKVNRRWKDIALNDKDKKEIILKHENYSPHKKALRQINPDYTPCYFNFRTDTNSGQPWHQAVSLAGLFSDND
jgi:hypothetical protein